MTNRRRIVALAAMGILVLAGCSSGTTGSGGAGKSGEKPIIGVIQITETHGYQQILRAGYIAQAKASGADVRFCVNDLDPGKTVSCAENLMSGGAKVLIVAPGDKGSFDSVVQTAKARKVIVVNDGSPEGISPDFVPFTGTDSFVGGTLAGEYAAKWIKTNLGGRATVAELTLPAFTDCVKRNEGFKKGLQDALPDAKIVASADGKGQRAKALPAMENMLQGNPKINVVFGCNDDSALGALSALTSANKPVNQTLVLGFDGTAEAFHQVKTGGTFRVDVVQRPDCYSRLMMVNAVKLAKGEITVQKLVADGLYLIKTPIVTSDNVDAWLKWDGTPETAPEKCVRTATRS